MYFWYRNKPSRRGRMCPEGTSTPRRRRPPILLGCLSNISYHHNISNVIVIYQMNQKFQTCPIDTKISIQVDNRVRIIVVLLFFTSALPEKSRPTQNFS